MPAQKAIYANQVQIAGLIYLFFSLCFGKMWRWAALCFAGRKTLPEASAGRWKTMEGLEKKAKTTKMCCSAGLILTTKETDLRQQSKSEEKKASSWKSRKS